MNVREDVRLVFKRLRFIPWFRDKLFRQLFVNASWLLSGTFVSAFLGVIAAAIKARTLGPELYGLLAVVMAYVAIIQRFTSFLPWMSLIKFGAELLEAKKPDQFMGLVKTSLILDIVGAISGVTIAISGIFIVGEWRGWDQQISHMVAVFSLSILFNLSGTPIGVLRILDRFKVFTAQKVLTAVLGLVGVLIVYISGGGIWGFLIVTLVTAIAGNLFLLLFSFLALRDGDFLQHWRASFYNSRSYFHFTFWNYLTSTLSIPIKQFDVIIAAAVVSLEAAGIYKIIKHVTKVLGMLIDPVYQAVYPQFSALTAQNNYSCAMRYAVKIGLLTSVTIVPLATVLAALSPIWLPGIFGPAYASGWLPLTVFLLFAAIGLSTIALHPLFLAMGYAKYNTIIALCSNGLYVGLAYGLGLKFGLVGIACAYGADIILVSLAKMVIIAKKLRLGTMMLC